MISRAPLPITVIIPLLFLFSGSILARYFFYRDPTSLFFDSHHGYDKGYSATRQVEADKLIEAGRHQTSLRGKGPSVTPPLFCIGIPTVARRTTGDVYVGTTVGSLLAGLDPTEREQIHLMLFIAHSNASIHPIYKEPWLKNVVDQTLSYEQDLHGEELENIVRMENAVEIIEKQMFDYTYLLDACLKVNASYVVTFEDDILALDGWFHRTKAALKVVEEQVKLLGLDEWFYLRLFYTEMLSGWNSEFWLHYLLSSLVVTTIALSVVSVYLSRTKGLRRNKSQVLGTTVIYCALAIGFFFACGRVSMVPVPRGVQQMSKYACCAQGLVLNRARVPRLIEYYREVKLGYVDSRAEELADTGTVGTRWAMTPSVIQHVGTHSSKGEDEEGESGDVSMSKQRWNFAFESNDAEELRAEHERVLQAGGV